MDFHKYQTLDFHQLKIFQWSMIHEPGRVHPMKIPACWTEEAKIIEVNNNSIWSSESIDCRPVVDISTWHNYSKVTCGILIQNFELLLTMSVTFKRSTKNWQKMLKKTCQPWTCGISASSAYVNPCLLTSPIQFWISTSSLIIFKDFPTSGLFSDRKWTLKNIGSETGSKSGSENHSWSFS